MNEGELSFKIYMACEKINKIENEMHHYDNVVRKLKELNKELKKVYEEYSALKIEAKNSGHADLILIPNKHFLDPPEFLEL